jgi:hypothetical protein
VHFLIKQPRMLGDWLTSGLLWVSLLGYVAFMLWMQYWGVFNAVTRQGRGSILLAARNLLLSPMLCVAYIAGRTVLYMRVGAYETPVFRQYDHAAWGVMGLVLLYLLVFRISVGYQISATGITTRHGVFMRRTHSIAFDEIRHVLVVQGVFGGGRFMAGVRAVGSSRNSASPPEGVFMVIGFKAGQMKERLLAIMGRKPGQASHLMEHLAEDESRDAGL